MLLASSEQGKLALGARRSSSAIEREARRSPGMHRRTGASFARGADEDVRAPGAPVTLWLLWRAD
jgi:hypothetical protein